MISYAISHIGKLMHWAKAVNETHYVPLNQGLAKREFRRLYLNRMTDPKIRSANENRLFNSVPRYWILDEKKSKSIRAYIKAQPFISCEKSAFIGKCIRCKHSITCRYNKCWAIQLPQEILLRRCKEFARYVRSPNQLLEHLFSLF